MSKPNTAAFGFAPLKLAGRPTLYDTIEEAFQEACAPAWPWPTSESVKKVPYSYLERRIPDRLLKAADREIDNLLLRHGYSTEGDSKL